jgi:hypothetical protein
MSAVMNTSGKMIDAVAPTDAQRKLYEADEHEWIAQQIATLRSGRLHEIDRDNLVEFLNEMTIRDRRELRRRFSVLIRHLLKARMQPAKMSRSWATTIVDQQDEIRGIFRDTPSIAQHAEALFADAYPSAVRKASAETGIPVARFPAASPWSIEEALSFTPAVPKREVSTRRK